MPSRRSAPADADWSLPDPGAAPTLRGREADHAILAIARARAHPLVTTAEILAAGVGPSGVSSRSATGFLRAVHDGVWRVGPDPLTAEGARLAAVLACVPGGPAVPRTPTAVLSHRTAAAHLHLVREDAPQPTVTVLGAGPGSRHPGIAVHSALTLDPHDVEDHLGVPCFTVGRLLLELAVTAEDHVLAAAIAEATYQGVLDRDGIEALVARSPGRRGAERLARMVGAPASPRVPTFAQARKATLRLLERAGLPAPALSPWLRTRDGHWIRPDLLWREARAVVELHPGDADDGALRLHSAWRLRQYRALGLRYELLSARSLAGDRAGTTARLGVLLNR